MPDLTNSESLVSSYVDVAFLKSEKAKQVDIFANAYTAMDENAAIADAQDYPGASATLEGYKRDMEDVIAWLASKNAEMKQAMTANTDETTDYTDVYARKKQEVEALRAKVQEARQLAAIRQEQVQALEQRDVGNYHSSWMGLARPLKEESRTGLLVAAGAFAILAVVGGYLVYKQTVPDTFRGGFRKGRYSS